MKAHLLDLSTLLALATVGGAVGTSALPTVDLGYEIHQAISFNVADQTYNFTNIRYAEPPLGNLRFAASVPPEGRNPVVQNGSQGAICPQAIPQWQAIAAQFVPAIVSGQLPFDYDAALNELASANVSTALDGRTTEDCLVLDVLVPKAVFDTAQKPLSSKRKNDGAPVVVWIYGGGYVFGSKELYGNPANLIRASQKNNSSGIIWVAMNYRLGAFGFLAGPSLQSNGTANAGLYDQRLALGWVQQHIAKFGGDPKRVTIIGESAGGGSIVHQLTAYGGRTVPPFQQAISQSGAWIPKPGNQQPEEIFQAFLSILNVTTLQEARNLPSMRLVQANLQQINSAPYGTYPYGPTVDGSFVPALPGNLLLAGSFAKEVNIMTGHNGNEGLYFVDPRIQNETDFEAYICRYLPSASDRVLDTITNDLYPPIYNGSQPYLNLLGRVSLFVSEAFLSCNTHALHQAYGIDDARSTYAYQFAVPPAIHGQDLSYTFYDGNATAAVANVTVAELLQDYIVSFAEHGVPSTAVRDVRDFVTYGTAGNVLNINESTVSTIVDPTANPRCLWWQMALYL